MCCFSAHLKKFSDFFEIFRITCLGKAPFQSRKRSKNPAVNSPENCPEITSFRHDFSDTVEIRFTYGLVRVWPCDVRPYIIYKRRRSAPPDTGTRRSKRNERNPTENRSAAGGASPLNRLAYAPRIPPRSFSIFMPHSFFRVCVSACLLPLQRRIRANKFLFYRQRICAPPPVSFYKTPALPNL